MGVLAVGVGAECSCCQANSRSTSTDDGVDEGRSSSGVSSAAESAVREGGRGWRARGGSSLSLSLSSPDFWAPLVLKS